MLRAASCRFYGVTLAATTLIGCLTMSAVGLAAGPEAVQSPPKQWLVYIGTYTKDGAPGIYHFAMDTKTGKLESLGSTDAGPNPTFLAIHPSGQYLYAANETGNAQKNQGGEVSAYAINRRSGELTPLNRASSVGAGPCHVVVDAAGKHVLLANYGGGSVTAVAIKSDGSLGDGTAFIQHEGSSVTRRQQGPHAHSINLDQANRYAIAADLGLDKLLVYRFDVATGKLTPNDPPAASVAPGAGPRHFAFHPNGKLAYVINELNSTVTAFEYDGKAGRLKEIQTLSTLPEGFSGNNSTAEVVVHPSGRYVYGSNRGHDSIAIYHVGDDGRLELLAHESTGGKTPRNFAIDPSGQFLIAANQGTNNVLVFKIDPSTGKLQRTGVEVEVPSPVCVRFVAREP